MSKLFLVLLIIVVMLEFTGKLIQGNFLEKESSDESNAVLGYSFMEMAHQTQRKSYLRIYARNVITLFLGIVYTLTLIRCVAFCIYFFKVSPLYGYYW